LLPKSGRALAVADGEGRNGVWLAEQGLDVVSIDFSPAAQRKGRKLAAARNVHLDVVQADVHAWDYPSGDFDVVTEIFTQFSSPEERAIKWAGMKRALKPGGLLIIQGYTPKQLKYAQVGQSRSKISLYTKEILEKAFGSFVQLSIVEEERELHEGAAHRGVSAVVGLTGQKP
jgi:SAM-dependent methyltransferase